MPEADLQDWLSSWTAEGGIVPGAGGKGGKGGRGGGGGGDTREEHRRDEELEGGLR
jgi:hypothetical protein